MADPQYNTVYSDLGYTYYPALIDKRGGSLTANDAPNDYLLRNEDYTAGAAITDSQFVLAEDVAAIQDAVLALERVLGKMPQGEAATVSARIAALSDSLQLADLDRRYGGETFADLDPAFAVGASEPYQPTIIGHRHTGAVNAASQPVAPSKISLADEVKDKLVKTFLQLDITASPSGALTGADIKLTADAGAVAISTAVSGLVSKTASNTISGNLLITGSMSSCVFAEYDCKDMVNLSQVADAGAWSGTSGVMAAGAASSATSTAKLRYGSYMISVRAKASANTNASTVLQVKVYSAVSTGPNVLIKTFNIAGTDFAAANTYQQFRVAFDHVYVTNGNKNIVVELAPAGSSRPSINFDSLVISPMGLSGYITQ